MESNSKINVLLDLDQTLISAEATEEYEKNFDKYKYKVDKFNFEDMDNVYIVFERPYLQNFLNYLFKNFNVSIWTAASKSYALFIIEKIILQNKKDRKLDYIFFSYHCNLSKKYKNGTKDLSMLWDEYKLDGYSSDNTIIIDDFKEVYSTQPNNCIIAKPFEFTEEGSEDDNFLKKLKKQLNEMKKNINNRTKLAEIVNDNMKKYRIKDTKKDKK